ncbi:MAG: endonuclease/exonuclease/phosphatase family protein [Actinomycetota bacterium]|nr:endonuclease/exonuclease/phosphatase family protein [Actinomycetota bacterium]
MASNQIVKVATFNARHGAGPFGIGLNRHLVATCRTLDADILALQEVDQRVIRSWFVDQPALIGRRLGQQVATARAKRTPVGGWQCNAICARGPLTEVEIVPLPGGPDDEERVVLLATVNLPGAVLSVACTHLQHRGGAPAQLTAALDALATRPQPRIIAGDFNLGADVVEPELSRRGYRPAETGPTFPATNPRTRIDWIAVEGDLEIVRTSVPQPLISDHRPVVADVEVVVEP